MTIAQVWTHNKIWKTFEEIILKFYYYLYFFFDGAEPFRRLAISPTSQKEEYMQPS
jgi:hypothetical protein